MTTRLHLHADSLESRPCDKTATDVPRRVSTAQTTHGSILPSTTASTGPISPVARISADELSGADEDADTLNLDPVVPPDETAAPALGATFRDGSCLAAVQPCGVHLQIPASISNMVGRDAPTPDGQDSP
ncbi:hypothetical protein E4U32_007171 [Claviceps aff. humidiphila group G2b]|nr:hypothetical protein E4U32_007171 [Claviceps aff. humidiphila group G2b]